MSLRVWANCGIWFALEKKIKKAEEKKTLISILQTCWSVLEDKEDAGLLDWSWMTDTE